MLFWNVGEHSCPAFLLLPGLRDIAIESLSGEKEQRKQDSVEGGHSYPPLFRVEVGERVHEFALLSLIRTPNAIEDTRVFP